MKRLYALLLFVLSLAFTGCTSYTHERFATDGKPIERTTLHAPFLTKTALQNLKTQVHEKRGTDTYSRTVGLDGVQNSVDSEGLAAMQALLGKLLLDGLKAAAVAP